MFLDSNDISHSQSLDKHEIIEIVEKFVDNIVMKCNVKHYSEIDKIRTIVSHPVDIAKTGLLTFKCTWLNSISILLTTCSATA